VADQSFRPPVEIPAENPDLRPILGESQLTALGRYGREVGVVEGKILFAVAYAVISDREVLLRSIEADASLLADRVAFVDEDRSYVAPCGRDGETRQILSVSFRRPYAVRRTSKPTLVSAA
jgi:hypothetical protein